MALTVAQLVMQITAEGADKARAALSGVNQEAGKGGGLLQKAAGGLLAFGAGAIGVGTVAGAWNLVTSQVGGFVQAAKDAQQQDAQTEAVIKSTGGAAGVTAEQVGNIAHSLAMMSGADDQAVQSAENMLLTFTNIHKDVFPKASQAALDMATSLNHGAIPSADQMSQVSIMLGKALNDPAKGMTALQRVGVTFDDAQKKLIKTYMKHGDIAKAQGVILAELNKEFGGSAQAAGGTMAGAMGKLGVVWQNAQEQVGAKLIPIITKLAEKLVPLVPVVGTMLAGAFTVLTVAMDVATAVFHFLSANGETVKTVLIGLGAGIAVVVAPILVGLIPAFIAWAVAAGVAAVATIAAAFPIVALVAGIALLVIGVKLLIDHFAQIVAWFKQVITNVMNASAPIKILAGILLLPLAPIILLIAGIKLLIDHWGQIVATLAMVAGKVRDFVGSVLGFIGDLVGSFLGFLGDLKDKALSLIQRAIDLWLDIYVRFPIKVLTVIATFVLNLLAKLGELRDKAVAKITELVTNILTTFATLPGKMASIGAQLISGLVSGLAANAGKVLDFVKNLAGNVISSIKGVFGIASPSRVMHAIGGHLADGLVNGLKAGNVHGRVASHLSTVGHHAHHATHHGHHGHHATLSGHAAHHHATHGHHGTHHAHPGHGHHAGSSSGETVINLVLDNRVIARALAPYIVHAAKIAGVKLS